MKQVVASQTVEVPKSIKIEVKARKVRVTGDRGTLTRDLKHLAVDIFLFEEDGKKFVKVECHFGKRRNLAAIRTVCSHIQNLFKGVTYGFLYKMRLVYAHFPINANIEDGGKLIEIRNFLGEKRVRVVKMLPGVKVERSSVKDQLVISGNDIEQVSRSAALINQPSADCLKAVLPQSEEIIRLLLKVCHVRNKDIRKFLDGVYVEDKGHITQPPDE